MQSGSLIPLVQLDVLKALLSLQMDLCTMNIYSVQSASCVKPSQIMTLYSVMAHVIVLSTKNVLTPHWTLKAYHQEIRAGSANFVNVKWKLLNQ